MGRPSRFQAAKPGSHVAPPAAERHHRGCAAWEVVCPDGRVRDYPYHNLGDAESTARLATERQCRLWPEPSPIELEQPPCPEGEHKVRPIMLHHADLQHGLA